MTDRARRLWAELFTNLCAMASAILAGALVEFSLPWVILASIVGGMLGWFAGAAIASQLRPWLKARSYAPAGRVLYRLRNLPPSETTAGGKARSLAAMIQAGHPVPDGVVLLPAAFNGDQLKESAASWLNRELKRLGKDRLFAVRSSALAEDTAQASFAGAYESVLDVPKAGLRQAIEKVRQSRTAERVQAYARNVGVDAGELAVVIQPMVPADLAGVLFTVDPMTGDLNKMLGNVVVGTGEALVSGAATGAEFTLCRPGGYFSGPVSLQSAAAQLHATAHDIENTFDGVAQDIEWVLSGGRLWILQARPITTMNPWKPTTAELNDSVSGNCLWSATNLSEANPVPQTPLTISMMRYQQAHGGPSMAIRGREMAGYIGGRPYANLSVQITARRGRKSQAEPREAYQALAGWWGELPAEVPVSLIPMTNADWKRAGLPLLVTVLRMSLNRNQVSSFVAANPARCARLEGLIQASVGPAELASLWQARLLPHSLRSFWAVIAAGSEGPAKLEASLREQFDADVVAALMSNLSSLTGDFASLGPVLGLGEIASGQLSRQDYIDRFGHRGVNEIELAWPRPAEDPSWLDTALAAADADVVERRTRHGLAYTAVMERIRAANPRQAVRLQRQLRKAAGQAHLRELARSESVRSTWVMRRFALRAGELLGIGDAVFLLTIEELLAALTGDRDAFASLPERREVYQRYLDLPALPGVIYGSFDPFAWAADPNRQTDYWVVGEPVLRPVGDDEVIRGCSGALGQVTATVRVLASFDQADELLAGEVLVTHLTNIGWTPLFPRAAAIVTDLGAPLSHAAIVARELGIPAVVGCGEATARLKTGDRVLVDGARGEVRLLG